MFGFRTIVTDDVACRQNNEVSDPTAALYRGLCLHAADAASGLFVLELYHAVWVVYCCARNRT